VLWRCWLGGRKGIWPIKNMGDGGGGHWLVRMQWRPSGWSVCLPLLIFPRTIKSRSSLLALAHPGGHGKRAVKQLWWWWCHCSHCHASRHSVMVVRQLVLDQTRPYWGAGFAPAERNVRVLGSSAECSAVQLMLASLHLSINLHLRFMNFPAKNGLVASIKFCEAPLFCNTSGMIF